MRGLGRVNLLVGGNNSGKTSILECIELLRSAGHPQVLASIAGRRGEWGYPSDDDARAAVGPRPEPVDVSHLFANRQLCSRKRIEADRIGDAASGGWNDKVTAYVEEPSGSDDEERNADMVGEDAPFVLHVKWRMRRTTSELVSPRTASCTDASGSYRHEALRARPFSSSGPAGWGRRMSPGRTAGSFSRTRTHRSSRPFVSSSRPSRRSPPLRTTGGFSVGTGLVEW